MGDPVTATVQIDARPEVVYGLVTDLTTKCTVTDAEPGRVFAFDVRHTVFPIARWRYDIVAADGGCRVTESTWDRRPGWFRKLAGRATGVTDRAAADTEHIQVTLRRLKQRAETGWQRSADLR